MRYEDGGAAGTIEVEGSESKYEEVERIQLIRRNEPVFFGNAEYTTIKDTIKFPIGIYCTLM